MVKLASVSSMSMGSQSAQVAVNDNAIEAVINEDEKIAE
jgi:hypothetical protein